MGEANKKHPFERVPIESSIEQINAFPQIDCRIVATNWGFSGPLPLFLACCYGRIFKVLRSADLPLCILGGDAERRPFQHSNITYS